MDNLKKQFIVSCSTITGLMLVFVPLLAFFYGKTEGELIQIVVFTAFISLGFIYLYTYFYKLIRFDYDNYDHPYRLLITFTIAFLFSMLFPLINSSGWIFLSVAVSIALFSNAIIGIYLTSALITYSCLLCNTADIKVFLVYFIGALIAVVLFQDIDEEFDVIHSLIIAAMTQFVIETAGFVLLVNVKLSAEQFIIPLVNTIINVIIIFWVLKYFNERIVNRYRNRYLEINDQEYEVLVELKNKYPKEYFTSIHTAYLVDRITPLVGCNINLAKSLAYYHRIKKVYSYTGTASERFVKDHRFPPEASDALLRYWSKKNIYTTKEEGIVFICDNVITTILSILNKDKKANINYDELYDTLINKDFMKKALSESDLSVKDFHIIREVVLKEKLYYDFLR